MPGTERLVDFPAKAAPVGADIIYVGDSAATYNEVKSTITQILNNVKGKPGSGLLGNAGGVIGFVAPIETSPATTITMASGNTYIADTASAVTFTLPTSPALGDNYIIVGASPFPWLLGVDGSGLQTIFFNGAATAIGAASQVVITPSSPFAAVLIECIGVNPGVEFDYSVSWTNAPLTLLTNLSPLTNQLINTSMDLNLNVTANNTLNGYATTATAAATTTLAVFSPFQQFFTGSTTQNVKMPVVTTLVLGQSWKIVNQSSGVVTVQSSGTNTIVAMPANSEVIVTCIKVTADTTAAAWYYKIGNITLPVPIADGGTGVTSVTTTPTASSFAGWDANKNMSANSFISAYTTTATAAATTTLLVGSTQQQFFTGSTTQTVLLPVTSTLVLGQTYLIVNNSTGVVTVQSSGANTIQAMAANTTLLVTCILTSGTNAASWNAEYVSETSAPGSVAWLANGALQSNATGDNTSYDVTFTASTQVNRGAVFDGTSTVTVNKTGLYWVYGKLDITGIGAGHTSCQITFTGTGGNAGNPEMDFNPFTAAPAGEVIVNFGALLNLTSGQTLKVNILVGNSTKTVNIQTDTRFGGYFIS